MRALVPTICAVVVLLAAFLIAQAQVATDDPADVARDYEFESMSIAMPPGYDQLPAKTVREVNPAYQNIRSWISSVGASIAINDLVGHGRSNGMCIVDTRTDSVIVTHTPTAPQADRFTPFLLRPDPLIMDPTMAPMGCAPGDFNGDGGMDLLVYYWGRTPIMFLHKDNAADPAPAYVPVEVVPPGNTRGQYNGERWNTNAVSIADFDGDGHPDIVFGNYFPNSGVLDPNGRPDVVMNDSMSNAKNAAGERVLRWNGNDPNGTPVYIEEKQAVPYAQATGWTLALGAGDLTGDLRPELYIGNDFGHDHLLYNESTPGTIRFGIARGERTWTDPKSFVLGADSFKGMGVDFVDLYNRGKFDMLVSNITTPWGIQESNFAWRNDTATPEDMRRELADGRAPFSQQAQQLGLAWSGWGWDIKAADLRNSGTLNVLQTTGFVKGSGENRWTWLQELATSNDVLVHDPRAWPRVAPGDDIAGDHTMAFYAKGTDGKYVNITDQLGTDAPIPTRGVAIADTTGTGTLDFAVARQWGAPAFFANRSPSMGNPLQLSLYRPAAQAGSGSPAVIGQPAYNATVTVRTADGRTIHSQLDGGSGHSGKRSFDVHFGLGASTGPVTAEIAWLDNNGVPRHQTLQLRPGTHALMLTDTATEIAEGITAP
ncbi:CRTAC1 family protein [Nocardia brasiliensis]|uniref:ASPIC/UnbV domain-containing protein n=1 Tax=Nocardia brasiliensis (strain ATCC 700358 / HUJEG-1) TaxID=1133849 RepID=K0EYK7_NOCB7|nr:CRTAC1 family protein [Nocardia brasiliensis]AFU02577.1 ASPIC/UnbV domain-containing protein [Nocardia brasiliensis ATCC 700358]